MGDGLQSQENLDVEQILDLLTPEVASQLSKLTESQQKELFASLKQREQSLSHDAEIKEKTKQEELEKFDSLIEEGKKYISEDKWQEWEQYESQFRGQMFSLDIIERSVKIMQMLDAGSSPEEIKNKMMNEWHGDGAFPIRNTVSYFSKHGKEFESMSKQWFNNEESIFDKIKNSIVGLFGKK